MQRQPRPRMEKSLPIGPQRSMPEPGSDEMVPAEVVSARLALFAFVITSAIVPAIPLTALLAIAFAWFAIFTDKSGLPLVLKFGAPFLALGLIGLLMSAENQRYEVWKDLWYISKIVLCLAVGILLGRREVNFSGLQPYLIAIGAVCALLSLFLLPQVERYELLPLETGNAQKLPIVAFVAVPVLLERIWNTGLAFKWHAPIILVMITVAAVLSDSRTTLVAILIMILAWAGFFSSMRKALAGGLLLLPIGFVVWQLLPEYHGGEMTALNKLKRSLDEMMLTDAYDTTAMIWNWRGFEAYNAQLMFNDGSIFQKFMGFGLGAEVNIGMTVQVSQELFLQYLPTLHNGFYYILIKFGLFGLAVYAWTVFNWARWNTVVGVSASLLSVRILRGMVVIVFASTAVITGLFNKTELNGLTILIGYLLGFLSIWRERSATSASKIKTVC